MVIFSDAPGFLANPADRMSVVATATLDDLEGLEAAAHGRARVKLIAVERALRGGVAAVGLCDGTTPQPLRSALAGAGSWFRASAAVPA
jgi:acetylglutamate/LysW-gamma-L-alpha-aminoadipate kinase